MKLTKATDLSTQQATYLMYAKPGVGKTTALKYLPGKTLVIDIDKSSIVLNGEENITIMEVDTHNMYQEWTEIVKDLFKNKEQYAEFDNIVVDNVSELFRATLSNLGREGNNDRVPAMSDYQRIDFTIIDSLRALKKLDKRLVITAWETSDVWESPGGQTFNRAMPDIRSKILNNFMGLCDVVARLIVTTDKDGNEKRGFILQPSNSVYAKNRLDSRKGCKVDELVEEHVPTP